MLLATVLAAGCGRQDAPPPSAKPPFAGGPKTSFHEVTSQLDPGGSVYLYLATDQWLNGLSKKITELRGVFTSMARPNPRESQMFQSMFDLGANLVRQSGIEDVTGVGLSAAPVAEGLFRNKLILHHASGSGKGFLWSAFGKEPHALAAADLLPSTTALAIFGDLDVKALWTAIQGELQKSGMPPAEEFAATFPQEFEKETGMSLAKLLGCFGGEVGIILTLDPDQPASLPLGGPRGKRMELPGPGLVVAVKVNNDYLYDQLSVKLKENPRAVSSSEGGLKMVSMEMPNPLELPLQVTLATGGGWLNFATTPELVKTVQAVRSGKTKGLKAGEEFQNLARHLPKEGNQLVYVSRTFGETMANFQRQAMAQSGLGQHELTVLQNLFGASEPSVSLSVGAHTATGWQTTTVGNRDNAAALLLAPTVGVAAVSAGLLLPALAKAKSRAQSINSVSNLKQLALGARMYANDNGDKLPRAQTWCDDLGTYIPGQKVFKAPNDSSPSRSSYAYNSKLAGRSVVGLAGDVVLFFEADATWNTSGGQDLLLPRPRSGGTYSIAFADGSVRMVNPNVVPTLRWEP